ncbi:MAG TPA: glycosyltransferase family 4 protein [Chthoniobacter sp.]
MKILVVTNLYPPHYIGGYELRCEVVVKALRARGHTVQVLTSDHGVGADTPVGNEPDVERSLQIHGFYGHPWLGIRKLRALESHNNRRVRAAVARHCPDVVHVWNLGGISKSIIFTLQRLGVPTVFDVSDHWIARSLVGDVWLRWWNQQDPPFTHRALRTAWNTLGRRERWQLEAPTNPLRHMDFSRIYFCSAALRDITASKGYAVNHGAVIHCPVDTTRFQGAPRPASAPLQKLLYVGRLSEDKGALTALKAMALVRDKFAGVLHLYGRGDAEYEAKLRSFAERERLSVEFRSATAAEMPQVYREHDALLFTSEWEEPFALTPLEAMASGLPVIGTTTGGSVELFRHQENALTYPAGDATSLASQIMTLNRESELRAAMAARGQAEVREKFAETHIIPQIEEYLRETVANWRPVRLPDFHE